MSLHWCMDSPTIMLVVVLAAVHLGMPLTDQLKWSYPYKTTRWTCYFPVVTRKKRLCFGLNALTWGLAINSCSCNRSTTSQRVRRSSPCCHADACVHHCSGLTRQADETLVEEDADSTFAERCADVADIGAALSERWTYVPGSSIRVASPKLIWPRRTEPMQNPRVLLDWSNKVGHPELRLFTS